MATKKKTEKVVEKTEPELKGFARLQAGSAPKQVEPAAKKSDRQQLTTSSEQEAAIIDEFCATNELHRITESRNSLVKQQALEVLIPKVIELFANKGIFTGNPSVVTDKSQLNFQIKHKARFELPKGPDGKDIPIRDTLQKLGFEEEVIKEIEEKVIISNNEFRVKSLSELQEGTPEEKSLCDKLSDLIAENFTQEEQAKLIEHYTAVEVDDSWKERSVQLACKVKDPKKRQERLAQLWSVIRPQFVPSHLKTTMSLDDIIRKVHQAESEPQEQVIEKDQYRAKVKGNIVELYQVAGKAEQLLGSKKCDNAGHAINSVKKWFREPEALEKQLAVWQAE